MKRLSILSITLFLMTLFCFGAAFGQSESDGGKLIREGQEIRTKAQSRADLDKAIKKFEEALAVFEKARSERGKAAALNNIGLVYNSLGQYSKALEYCEKDLAITGKLGDVKGKGVITRFLTDHTPARELRKYTVAGPEANHVAFV
jgi:tetratricopeptide (TPR) repeat protein